MKLRILLVSAASLLLGACAVVPAHERAVYHHRTAPVYGSQLYYHPAPAVVVPPPRVIHRPLIIHQPVLRPPARLPHHHRPGARHPHSGPGLSGKPAPRPPAHHGVRPQGPRPEAGLAGRPGAGGRPGPKGPPPRFQHQPRPGQIGAAVVQGSPSRPPQAIRPGRAPGPGRSAVVPGRRH